MDFHIIRNRHLEIFRQFEQRKREIAAPTLRGQAKIEGIKATALAVDRNVRARNNLLSKELIGRRVQFWA
jgi:hypothetical protein